MSIEVIMRYDGSTANPTVRVVANQEFGTADQLQLFIDQLLLARNWLVVIDREKRDAPTSG